MLQLQEIEKLKFLSQYSNINNNPQNFANQYIKQFLNKLFIEKDLDFMVRKRELTFVLPYLGKLSLDLITRLRQTIERGLPYCKLKVIFRSKWRLNKQFLFKDSFDKKSRSGIIYRYMCSKCKVTYNDNTFRHFHNRVAENMGISNLTQKRFKNVTSTVTQIT